MKALIDLVKKRDMWYLLAIVYLVSKVYVLSTPSPNDDDLPDKVRDAVVRAIS